MLPPPCSRQAWETPAGEIKPQTHLLLSTPLPPGLNYAQKQCWPGRGLSPCEGWAEAGLGHWGTGAQVRDTGLGLPTPSQARCVTRETLHI